MRFHQISMVGEFNVEVVSSLPTFDSTRDKGRILYSEQDNKVFFGTGTEWQEVSTDADLSSHISTDVPAAHNAGTMSEQNNDDVEITGGLIGSGTTVEALSNHTSNTNDPHDTISNYQAPGYIIYYKNTNQLNYGYEGLYFDEVADEWNNTKVSADNDMDRFTLEKGFYRISYLVRVYELNSTPPASARIYNVTKGESLDYTRTDCELDSGVEHNTLSFSFPVYFDQQTDIELQYSTASSQEARVDWATLCIETVFAEIS